MAAFGVRECHIHGKPRASFRRCGESYRFRIG